MGLGTTTVLFLELGYTLRRYSLVNSCTVITFAWTPLSATDSCSSELSMGSAGPPP